MSEALADRRQDRDAFVLVLIDGDGMIFDDKLTSRGELEVEKQLDSSGAP